MYIIIKDNDKGLSHQFGLAKKINVQNSNKTNSENNMNKHVRSLFSFVVCICRSNAFFLFTRAYL